jgi:uncharacterized protein YdiU (UPF0061 family)
VFQAQVLDNKSDERTNSSRSVILELGPAFYEGVEAAKFPALKLRYRNQAAARTVGLDGLSDEQWLAHFGRFEPFSGNLARPLALRYHGHQFRH